jgi:hypothetical protein
MFRSRILFKAHSKIKMRRAETTANSSAQDHCYKNEQAEFQLMYCVDLNRLNATQANE